MTSDLADLAFTDFREAFELDPVKAVERFLDLLLEPEACELRCALLMETGRSNAGRDWAPAGNLSLACDYNNVLSLLASGRLGKAVAERKVDIEHLVQLASHPAALLLASRVLWEGQDALVAIANEL